MFLWCDDVKNAYTWSSSPHSFCPSCKVCTPRYFTTEYWLRNNNEPFRIKISGTGLLDLKPHKRSHVISYSRAVKRSWRSQSERLRIHFIAEHYIFHCRINISTQLLCEFLKKKKCIAIAFMHVSIFLLSLIFNSKRMKWDDDSTSTQQPEYPYYYNITYMQFTMLVIHVFMYEDPIRSTRKTFESKQR